MLSCNLYVNNLCAISLDSLKGLSPYGCTTNRNGAEPHPTEMPDSCVKRLRSPTRSAVIEIPETAVAALKVGDKVEAVKATRHARRVSLKEAGDAVDDYLVNNADVNDVFLQKRKESGRTLSIIFKIGIVLLLAAIVAAHFGL